MERVKQHGIRGAKVFSDLAGAASWIVAGLVLDREALSVPASFLNEAPQLALVNNGKIIEVPGRDETAETFLRRVR